MVSANDAVSLDSGSIPNRPVWRVKNPLPVIAICDGLFQVDLSPRARRSSLHGPIRVQKSSEILISSSRVRAIAARHQPAAGLEPLLGRAFPFQPATDDRSLCGVPATSPDLDGLDGRSRGRGGSANRRCRSGPEPVQR